MKKLKLMIIFLTLCFVISVVINFIMVQKFNDLKKDFIAQTYHQLRNVYNTLNNLEKLVNDPLALNQTLPTLSRESVVLDNTISTLSRLSSNKYIASSSFELLNQRISASLYSSDYQPSQILQDIAHYKAIIIELIQNISHNQQLQYDEYGQLINNPDDSLKLETFFRYINQALERL